MYILLLIIILINIIIADGRRFIFDIFRPRENMVGVNMALALFLLVVCVCIYIYIYIVCYVIIHY